MNFDFGALNDYIDMPIAAGLGLFMKFILIPMIKRAFAWEGFKAIINSLRLPQVEMEGPVTVWTLILFCLAVVGLRQAEQGVTLWFGILSTLLTGLTAAAIALLADSAVNSIMPSQRDKV